MESTWGVNEPRLLAELDGYNSAVREGRGARLVPPRLLNQQPLDEGPFYAMTCVGAITIPYGGLWVNGYCQVRDRSGSPIGGLFAAGADAGGVFNRTYGGGLAWALVSGRVAGRNAAKSY
jgi:succinate dehydrogenase/fumarate reductase flavoprotein subunit